MTTIDIDHNTAATNNVEQKGRLEYRNPCDLALELNIRDAANLDKEFLASVAEHGVLSPIVAVEDNDGVVRVRAGQRRALAAREAGLAEVPVYIRRDHDTADDPTVARVSQQMVENDHRLALTDAQRAAGVQQLLDTGLSITKAAKKLAVPTVVVKNAKTVARSQTATEALNGGQLSLTEAAVLAELDIDADPAAVDELVGHAGTGAFAHAAERIRRERESEKAYRSEAARWTEAGYTVLEAEPSWSDQSCVRLDRLYTPEGEPATQADIRDPAAWAVLLIEGIEYRDTATGEPVDGDTVDWDAAYGGDVEDGYRDPATVTENSVFTPEWFCLDTEAAGLTFHPLVAGQTDAQDAAGSDAEQQQREQAKSRERRKVLKLNKLGRAAASVRHDFISTLLARKTSPKGAAVFIAQCLAADPGLLEQHGGRKQATDMLGANPAKALADDKTSDNRAQVIVLALVLGALAARCPKDAWRGVGSAGWTYSTHRCGAATLLRFLADNGYTLAEVEQVIVGETTADQLFDQHDTARGEE